MIPLVVLLSCVVAGAIGLQIGQHRGRAPAGFAWGFFLGPLGWLIVLTGPDLRPKCDQCRGAVMPGSRRCLHCGSDLGLEDTAPIPFLTREEEEENEENEENEEANLFDIDFEGELHSLRPVVVFNCLACGRQTRTPLPTDGRERHQLSCDCGFTLSVSSEELIAQMLEAGAVLGDGTIDSGG